MLTQKYPTKVCNALSAIICGISFVHFEIHLFLPQHYMTLYCLGDISEVEESSAGACSSSKISKGNYIL